MHGGVVAALWALAVTWIITDPLTGTHSGPTQRWMENVALLLVAAACTTLMMWLIQSLVTEPRRTADRAFELGYHAGHTDALNENRQVLSLVGAFRKQHERTGS